MNCRTIVLCLAAAACALSLAPRASAMRFYNNSDHSVFVYVVVGHDAYEQKAGSFQRALKPGDTWVYKPGNLHMQAQREYSYFVWTSFDAWKRAEMLGGFLGALSTQFKLLDSWYREKSMYKDSSSWPKGLLMIAEGFDDDGFWLKYYGPGHTPFAEKGGCSCPGKDWYRSGYGCTGQDWGLSGFTKPAERKEHPDKACVRFVPEKYAKAEQKGRWACPGGAFHDPRNGGECWECPKDTRRTAYPVNQDKACVRPAYEKFKQAEKKRKNTRVGEGCPAGQFWDVKGGDGLLGACYSCEGYRRTAHPVDHKHACAKGEPEQLMKATFVRKHGCSQWPGSFHDPRNGGECWKCPADYERSITPVTSKDACKKPETREYRASQSFSVRR